MQEMVIGAIATDERLTVENADWLCANLRNWLARWDVRLAYTNLTGQASHLWAEVLISASIPYRVVAHREAVGEGWERLLDHASAVHWLSVSEPDDSWEQIQSACDVVIGMGAAAGPQSALLRSLGRACEAHCGAVLLDHAARGSSILCRNSKW